MTSIGSGVGRKQGQKDCQWKRWPRSKEATAMPWQLADVSRMEGWKNSGIWSQTVFGSGPSSASYQHSLNVPLPQFSMSTIEIITTPTGWVLHKRLDAKYFKWHVVEIKICQWPSLILFVSEKCVPPPQICKALRSWGTDLLEIQSDYFSCHFSLIFRGFL